MAKTKKDEVVSELHEETLEGKDLEKATEAESLETAPEGVPSNIDTEGKKPKKVEKTKEEKLKALKEKAEKILHEKVEKTDSELLKEEVKVKKKSDMLIDLEDYVKLEYI